MRILKRLCTIVGSMSEWSGRVVMFLVLVLVASITYDVVMRYVFDAPTIWSYSFSYMLGTSIVAMGMPYVHHRGAMSGWTSSIRGCQSRSGSPSMLC